MMSWYLSWPENLSQWSRYSFGMYLIHPAIMDVVDVALLDLTIQPDWYVLMKYCVTAFLSLAITIAIGKVKYIAWTVGLGPLPWIDSKVAASQSGNQSNRIQHNVQ